MQIMKIFLTTKIYDIAHAQMQTVPTLYNILYTKEYKAYLYIENWSLVEFSSELKRKSQPHSVLNSQSSPSKQWMVKTLTTLDTACTTNIFTTKIPY